MLIRSIRLMFNTDGVEGGDEGAGGGEQQEQVADLTQQPVAPAQEQQPTGSNPAWEKLRSELDPISFSKIEPHLKEMDKAAQSRIESVNSKYAPFQQSLEGRDPAFVQKAITYSEALEANPEQVYQMLGDFLQQNGRLPSAQEAEDALDEQGEADAQPVADPRIDQIAEYIQRQERAEATRQAEADFDSSLGKLKTTHAELAAPEAAADLQEIIKRAAFVAQQTPGQDIDFNAVLEAAYQDFAGLKNRILTTPRPGDSAPQLPPISGGAPTPAGQQQKSWGSYKDDEIQNFIAGQLAQNKG